MLRRTCTNTQRGFFLPNYPPACGKAGCVYQQISEVWRRGNTRIKTVTDTLFLAIQRGNIKVHTLFFWKIKPSGWQTCLAKKSRFGIHAHSQAHCAEELELAFFHSYLILPDYVYDLKKQQSQGHCTMVRMRKVETSP